MPLPSEPCNVQTTLLVGIQLSMSLFALVLLGTHFVRVKNLGTYKDVRQLLCCFVLERRTLNTFLGRFRSLDMQKAPPTCFLCVLAKLPSVKRRGKNISPYKRITAQVCLEPRSKAS